MKLVDGGARALVLCSSVAVALGAVSCGRAAPDRTDPGVVALEGTLGNTFVPAGHEGQVLARVRVSTTPVRGGARPPINLGLVVDTSGSMEGEPIEDAREASLAMLDLLREGDRISVVAFHSTVDVLLPSTPIEDGDIDELRRKIGRMEARGTTDMAAGLTAGLQQVMSAYDPNGINRIVLLGDGVPNDASSIVPTAQAAGERGIAITSLGLGLDYDETLMGDIARVSGGSFTYVERSEQVAAVFRDEVLRMQRVLGRNAVVALQPGPGVRIDSVVGQNVTPSGEAVYVTLGDLHEGEHRDLIVRATVAGRRDGSRVELFDVHLRFEDAVREAGALERRVFLGARSTADQEDLARGRNEEIEREAARLLTAAVSIEAIRVARGGELERAREMLRQAEASARLRADDGDEEAATEATSLGALYEALPVVTGSSTAAGPPAAAPVAPANEQELRRRVNRVHSTSLDRLGF